MTIKKERDTFFDGLKFVLIILVVFGHVMGRHMSDTINLNLITFIWFFHMPLFVFISGYFTNKKQDLKSLKKWLIPIFETFICFDIIYLLYPILAGTYSHKQLLVPQYLTWYLLSLIYWRIFIQFVPDKILNKKSFVLILSVIVSLLFLLIPYYGRLLSYQRTIGLLPFFLLGYYAKNTTCIERIKKINPIITGSILIGIFIGISLLDSDLKTMLLRASHFANDRLDIISDNTLLNILVRIFCLIIAIIMSVCVINLCKFTTELLRFYGKDTMLFFIYHGLFIHVFIHIFNKLNILSEYPFVSDLFMFVIIMILLFIMVKFRIFHLLINPISNFRKYITTKYNNQKRI